MHFIICPTLSLLEIKSRASKSGKRETARFRAPSARDRLCESGFVYLLVYLHTLSICGGMIQDTFASIINQSPSESYTRLSKKYEEEECLGIEDREKYSGTSKS